MSHRRDQRMELSRTFSVGQLVVLESHDLPGNNEARVITPSSKRGLKEGKDFRVAFSPEREDTGNAKFKTVDVPKVVGTDDDDARASAEAALRQLFGKRSWRFRPDGSPSRQAARRTSSQREHRARERAEDGLRPDGHRRLGGDRGGQDQAVRLYAVLSGPGAGRPLHPDRSLLPDLEGSRVRVSRPASSSWPARSTPACRTTSIARLEEALNAGASRWGARSAGTGARLQEGRRRRAREPVVRGDRAAATARARTSRTTTRTCRRPIRCDGLRSRDGFGAADRPRRCMPEHIMVIVERTIRPSTTVSSSNMRP